MSELHNGAFSSELAVRLARQGEWWFDESLASALARLFHGKSVGDFGAGIGRYVDFLRSHGVKCQGYDAIPHIETISGGRVDHLDLCVPSPPPASGCFDWALCLEVMEHIPPEFQSVALANLDHHNTCGIVLSWALPGQGGRGHVNEQPNRYVIDQLTARGYAHDQATQEHLRQAARISWFKNTVMVFRKPGS